MAEDKELSFEIVQRIGTIYDGAKKSKELNIVKWGGREAKFDLRTWDKTTGKPGKGITMSADELEKFKALVDKILAD